MILTGWLVFGRVSGLLAVLPLFNTQGVPRYVPILLSVVLTIVLTPLVPLAPTPPTLGLLLMGVASELMLGLLMGSIVAVIFGALAMASEAASMQMGMGMASLFNPLQKTNSGALGNIATWLAGMVFLTAGVHLHCLEIVAASFDVVHPGSMPELLRSGPILIQSTGESIALGGRLAGPVLGLVWMVNLFVAVLTKLAPRMNVYFSMGTILTSSAGLALFAMALPNLLVAHATSVEASTAWLIGLIEVLRGG